jgi:sugar transferase (PEP-CTERM/EpsH1 system associated)
MPLAATDRPAVLYLVHRVPYPPDKGDRIRAYHIVRHLAGRADVYLACLADEPVAPESVAALERLCKKVEVVAQPAWRRWGQGFAFLGCGRTATEGAFRSRRLANVLRQWAATTPFVSALASSSGMVPYLRMNALRNVPAVVDLVDVDSQKWLDYAAVARGPKRWVYRLEGERLRKLEGGLPTWVRAVTLVSAAEAELYGGFAEAGAARVVSNGVDQAYFRSTSADSADEAAERDCAFVGALDYPPNVDGVCWFCQEVWPEILCRRPSAKISLIGRRPSASVRQLAALPGVELVGQVPDVRPALRSAAVAVVPLRIARGVQNKVLEALAMGKATVASPQALAGLRANPGVPVLEATTPAEWADAVTGLLDDAARRRELGHAGVRYVAAHHNWDRCLEPLLELLDVPARDLKTALPDGTAQGTIVQAGSAR